MPQQALAPLAIAVPLVTAALLVVLGPRMPRQVTDAVATVATLVVVGCAAGLLMLSLSGRVVTWVAGWTPRGGLSVGIVLVVDQVGAALALAVALLALAAFVYSWRYFEAVEALYHVLMLGFLAGMTGFALTGDLFDMFVFFELMGAVAYALTAYKIEEPQPLQGAINFGIVNSLGAYASLTGIALLYGRTGELGLAQMRTQLAGHRPDALVVAAFVLVVTGFLVKAAMVPFHFWTADAEAVAPTPVCALFSGVMVTLGVYGVARVYWVVFSATIPGEDFRRTFLALGTLTALLGAVVCFAQHHLKRLLAYSTVSHVGLFLLGVAVLTHDGLAGAALYAAGYAGVKSALFLTTGVLLNRYETVDEWELHGAGRGLRVSTVVFLLGGLGLSAAPPFGTFLGKSVAEEALAAAGFPWGYAVFVLASALTGGAVIRAGMRVFLGLGLIGRGGQREEPTRGRETPDASRGEQRCEEARGTQREEEPEMEPSEEEPESKERLLRIPTTMLAATLGLLLGGLAVGVIPGVTTAALGAAAQFTDASAYVAQALHGAPPHPVSVPAKSGWTALGVGLGLLSTALAVGFACLAIWQRRLPEAVRTVGRGASPALAALRRLHSGHVGDYVAWVIAGIVVLAAFIGLPQL